MLPRVPMLLHSLGNPSTKPKTNNLFPGHACVYDATPVQPHTQPPNLSKPEPPAALAAQPLPPQMGAIKKHEIHHAYVSISLSTTGGKPMNQSSTI
jgi:hypothetical protein